MDRRDSAVKPCWGNYLPKTPFEGRGCDAQLLSEHPSCHRSASIFVFIAELHIESQHRRASGCERAVRERPTSLPGTAGGEPCPGDGHRHPRLWRRRCSRPSGPPRHRQRLPGALLGTGPERRAGATPTPRDRALRVSSDAAPDTAPRTQSRQRAAGRGPGTARPGRGSPGRPERPRTGSGRGLRPPAAHLCGPSPRGCSGRGGAGPGCRASPRPGWGTAAAAPGPTWRPPTPPPPPLPGSRGGQWGGAVLGGRGTGRACAAPRLREAPPAGPQQPWTWEERGGARAFARKRSKRSGFNAVKKELGAPRSLAG